MARKKDRTKPPQEPKPLDSSQEGEQLDLLDVGPENSKEIIRQAKLYRSAQKVRMEALKDEVTAKTKLLELIKAAELHPDDTGKIRCKCYGYTITVTPRDELIRIKEDESEED